MHTQNNPLAGTRSPSIASRGFALVVTLSLMISLTVIAVGLLTLSSISLRSSTAQGAQAAARANARMAMLLAIGELQKMTGPDQRITLTSGLRSGDDPANPNWTGATDVSPAGLTPDAKNATIKWLVSGVTPDPAKALTKSTQASQGDALKLGTFNTSPTVTTDLLAPLIRINQGNNKGRYAWWIGDEGTKARVDVAKPETAPTTNLDRLVRSQVPLEAGFAKRGEAWSVFAPAPGGTIDKAALLSVQTASLAAANKTLATEYFNDVIQPVLGVWNPYNIVIKSAPYRFDWALYPYFRFNYAKPTGTGTFTDGRLTKLWLRDEWTSGSGIPTPDNGSGGTYFTL